MKKKPKTKPGLCPLYRCRNCRTVFLGSRIQCTHYPELNRRMAARWSRERSGLTELHDCDPSVPNKFGVAELIGMEVS